MYKIFAVLSSLIFSFENSTSQPKGVLFTIDTTEFISGEFIYTYQKNIYNKKITKQKIDEYLELYINFKLKVREAYERGIDTSITFKKEYNHYLDQLHEPYLSVQDDNERLIKEAYQRLQEEIHVSHLLIKVDQYASASDTLVAYKKIMEIKNSITIPADFEQFIIKFSEEPGAAKSKGDLGYFSVFKMVYPF